MEKNIEDKIKKTSDIHKQIELELNKLKEEIEKVAKSNITDNQLIVFYCNKFCNWINLIVKDINLYIEIILEDKKIFKNYDIILKKCAEQKSFLMNSYEKFEQLKNKILEIEDMKTEIKDLKKNG